MAGNKVKLGILLPTRGLIMADNSPQDADNVLEMARLTEDAGLDSVWVGDSLTAKPRLEPLTTLAAVAGCTNRVRLGTAVLLAALRHPVLLAQVVGTLDLISKGRLILAVGAGGAFNEDQKKELEVANINPSSRAKRLEELMEILKRLGEEPSMSFHGHHFQLDSVSMEPKPVQRTGVPLLFACHLGSQQETQFDRAMRLGDGYISISETPKGYAEVSRGIQRAAEKYGKPLDQIEASFYMTINLNRDPEKARQEADSYLALYYGKNIWQELWGPWGAPELTVESIRQYVAAGAKTIIVRFASFNQLGQFHTFVNEVVPHV